MEVTTSDDLSNVPASVLIVAIRSGMSIEQLDLMLDVIASNNMLRNNVPRTRQTKKIQTMLWDNLSGHLNALGPFKNVTDWHETWSKLIDVGKIRYLSLSRARFLTGTISPVTLGYYDERVLDIIGLKKNPICAIKFANHGFNQSAHSSSIQMKNNPSDISVTDLLTVIQEVNYRIRAGYVAMNDTFDRIIFMVSPLDRQSMTIDENVKNFFHTVTEGSVNTDLKGSVRIGVEYSVENVIAVTEEVSSQLKDILLTINHGFNRIVNAASTVLSMGTMDRSN